MRRILLLSLALTALACTRKPEPLQSGDLLFVGIPADYSLDDASMESAIGAATAEGAPLNIIHVAILDIDSLGTWIIDATIKRGVDRHPLDTFLHDFTLKDGALPVMKVMRLKDKAVNPKTCVQNARRYLGLPYDVYFLPDNDAFYCSELVQCSYLDADGSPLFGSAPMNFKNADGEFPLYWQQLFGRIGQPIPQGVSGTNPRAMSENPQLTEIDFCMDNDFPLYLCRI